MPDLRLPVGPEPLCGAALVCAAPALLPHLQALWAADPSMAERPAALLALLADHPAPATTVAALDAAVVPLHGLARLLLSPDTPAPSPARAAALHRLAATPSTAAALQGARGGGLPAPSDLGPTRHAVHVALEATRPQWTRAIDDLRHLGCPALAPLQAGLHQSLAWLCEVARLHGLVGRPPPPPDPRTLPAARRWLARPGRLDHLQEHQAFGFPDDPTERSETRWLRARTHLALHRSGLDQTPALVGLWAARPASLPRWYDQWAGIPPDTDSLGTWLEVATVLGAPVPAAWHAALTHMVGPSPTWLTPSRPAWGGPDCATVRLRLTRALLDHPELHGLPVVRANLADLLAHPPGTRSWHYPEPRALAFALELAAALARVSPRLLEGLPAAAWCDTTRSRAEHCLLWSAPRAGPMAVAALAGGLLHLKPRTVAISPALRYLERTQRPDGSWDGEPAFVIPGRPPHPQTHLRDRVYTTAVVVEGLARAVQEFPGAPP